MQRTLSSRFVLLFSLGLIYLLGCDVIFEEDITNQEITLLAPSDGLITEIQTINFDWQHLNDAVSYRIQIGTPDFDNLDQIILDSLVMNSELTTVLSPGFYEWRVRGENSGSMTPFVVRSITINSSEGLSGQIPLQTAPLDGAYMADSQVTFSWSALIEAETYTVEILENDNGLSGTLVQAEVAIEETEIELELDEGQYFWRVIAANSIPSQSEYSEERLLIIDSSPPVSGDLIQPNDAAFLTAPTQEFSWDDGIDENLQDYQLFIFEDVQLTTIVHSEQSSEPSLQVDLSSLNPGTYYWQIRTNDLAGNYSLSMTRSFSR